MNLQALLALHFVSQGLFLSCQQAAARRRLDPWVLNFASAATTVLGTLPLAATWLARSANAADVASTHTWAAAAALGTVAVLGAFYSLLTYTRLRAQQLLPGHVYAPLARMGLLIVLAVSMAVFGEKRTPFELLALAAAFVPLIYFQAFGRGDGTVTRATARAGIMWAVAGALLSAGLQLSSKVILDPVFSIGLAVPVFVVGSNIGGTLLSAGMCIARGDLRTRFHDAMAWGVVAGALNVIAFLSLALALVSGSASVTYSVSALAIVVPAATAAYSSGRRWSLVEGLMASLALAAATIVAM